MMDDYRANGIRTLLLLVLVLASCQNNAEKNEELIEIVVPGDKELLSNLSDFFSSIEYVLLEDSDENPLVQPYKIISYDSLIFVEDQELDNLLVYKKTGEFKFALKSSGGGPEEFNQIEDFQVTENSIVIKDNVLMKFIQFDFSGNYVGESKHQLLSMNFAKSKDFEIHFFNNSIQTEPYNFLTIQKRDSTYAVPIKEGYEGLSLVHQSGFTYLKGSHNSFLNLPFSYDVFQFDSFGQFEKMLRFNFGSLSLTDQERLLVQKGQGEPSQREFVIMLRSFYPVKQGFIFNYYSNLRSVFIGELDSDYSLIKIGKNLVNDLDGVPLILVPWSYHEKGLILKESSQAVARTIANRQPVSEIKSNLESFVRHHSDELNADRHVLVFLNR
ncbi:6-bladed beta-propeller [Algoriphagus namhaensis]